MKPTAILLLHCPDQQGIISDLTKFITDNKGNIVYLDQYVDHQDGMFFMRIEWELDVFLIPRDKIEDYISTLYAQRYQMTFSLYFNDVRPRMAIFVSKMSHCLYDLLARYKAGEWDVDIPCIISNHEDLRYIADQFDIPNIHHSFLPAFIGPKPYHQAWERGVKIIGATSHYVTTDLDAGPIIEQDVVRITHKDTPESLVLKGRDLEKIVLSRAVTKHIQRKILTYHNKTIIFS